MKTLLLMPDTISSGTNLPGADDPVTNARALATALGGRVDVLDHSAADRECSPLVRAIRRLGGPDAALALLAFARSREYDAVFSGSEGIGLPLAAMFQTALRRPAHVMVGHRLSAHWGRRLTRPLGLGHCVDALLVHSQAQRDFAEDRLGIAPERLTLMPPPVDDHFFRPCGDVAAREELVCAAGLQWRDYPTLLHAVGAMPDLQVRLATFPGPASPDFGALRALFAQSSFVAVPVCEADFAAGATTILQAMALGKAVLATRIEGQTDLIIEGVTGMTVSPGNVDGWRRAITRLREDAGLRERLGRNARRWVEEHAAQDRWAARVAETLRACVAASAPGPAATDSEAFPGGMNNAW